MYNGLPPRQIHSREIPRRMWALPHTLDFPLVLGLHSMNRWPKDLQTSEESIQLEREQPGKHQIPRKSRGHTWNKLLKFLYNQAFGKNINDWHVENYATLQKCDKN